MITTDSSTDAPRNPALCEQFISDRIANNESVIFVALDDGNAVAFTQLYPSFCSVDAVKILILYDLYVAPNHRNRGVGALLMNRARDFAEETGVARIDLLTAKTNLPGQHLYEKLGYCRTLEDFHAYSLSV